MSKDPSLLLRNEYEFGNWRTFANMFDGEKINLTYNFRTEAVDQSFKDFGDSKNGFRQLSDVQKNAVELALAEISSVCGVTFTKSDSKTASVMFGTFDINAGTNGYTSYILRDPKTGASANGLGVWLTTRQDYEPGSVGYYTILHEVSHVLGLEHTFEGANQVSFFEDMTHTSVMSYKDSGGPYHLRPYDIIALQSIYGPPKTKLENTTFVLGADKVIFDGGGTDTISAKNAKMQAFIDLTAGSWNSIGKTTGYIEDKSQVWLGHFSDIENAVGSKYNDVIQGNGLVNGLNGGAGRDRLNGRDGDDNLKGEAGNDTLSGGAGEDRLYGGSENDVINGGSERDTLWGQTGHDRLYGDEDQDNLYGSSGNDTLYGGTGDDLLRGDAGNDRLYGNADVDRLYGGAGNDVIVGGSGDDRILGQSGNDKIVGQTGRDTIYTGSGTDVIAFRSYSEMGLIGENDSIQDFSSTNDVIDLRSLDANLARKGHQTAKFLGNSSHDGKLNSDKAGQFYYNTSADELRFDGDGDGIVDYAIGVEGVSIMKADYFLL